MTGNECDFYIEDERLAAFASSTARRLKIIGEGGARALIRQVRAALEQVERAAEKFEKAAQAEGGADGRGAWLLDNRYLARREALSAADELRAAKRVRLCADGALLGEAGRSLVRAGAGEITPRRLEQYLTGFQTVTPLRREELTLMAAALKCALVIELGSLCETENGGADAFERIFSSLRLLSTLDLSELLDRVDLTEQLLMSDPAGVYPLMDERTRDMYRRQVTRLAGARGCTEQSAARRALSMAEEGEGRERHVGFWLFTRPLGDGARENDGQGYAAVNVLSTLVLSLLAGFLTDSAAAFFLLLLPVSELVKLTADFIILRTVRPRLIPRMALTGGVPDAGRTICCISALLTSPESGRAFAARLEEARLASRECGENLLFGILADLPEAPERTMPGDAPALEAAAEAVEKLNEKYGGGFCLLCRRRSYDAVNSRWISRERKRGALLSLAALICGRQSDLSVVAGDGEKLSGARYILTLDADTRLLPGTAAELIGAMLHPLNAPVVDEKRLAVVSGYGLIHPRMDTLLSSAQSSGFARLLAPQGGFDAYGSSCGEVGFDLTGRGGFAGKGIIDAAVLLRCTSRLPEGRILSHDAVEGALLRGGYMSDSALSDGFPASPLSYYKRAHRWIRGDWQNAGFIFSRRLAPMDKWKLFDSLRRSLVPAGELAALLAAFLFSAPGTLTAAVAALAAAGFPILTTAAGELTDHGRVRLFGGVVHGLSGELCRVLTRLVLLPADAWVSVSAAAQSAWRMCVTKKELMQWQTAAQAEAGAANGPGAYYSALWFAPLCGAVGLLSPSVIGKAAGVMWLLAPATGFSLGRRPAGERTVTDSQREYLMGHAAKIWDYFRDFCRESDGYLPPDNVQLQPPTGAAHRTSPTNIGLALTACLAARDLELDGSGEAFSLAGHILDTVESLPKWHGHLYNWYDTRTRSVLSPRYVSTVDSGNLAACLIACREGFAEYGEAELSRRAGELYSAMDFSPLYDKSRRLFRIGWDEEEKKLTEGWYDLMSSEARLTGYLAVAKGDAPKKHWRQLSRALVGMDGYRGMASWTGTMFEYLMPELFLPLCRDSLLWETARFCLRAQRRRAPRGTPWGESESAFYALSRDLSYRYKAHGCAALALKRDMDDEYVVSPYSSFLALAVAGAPAIKNLQALEGLSAVGQYGFYEAVDYTPDRCPGGQGETVRCFMAHHLGMSLAAIDNFLRDGAIQRRFMADKSMSAYRSLLEEKAPMGGAIMRHRSRDIPEKPARYDLGGWEKRGEGTDFAHPECCVLSNGVYSVMLTESGLSRSSVGGVDIYAGPVSELTGPAGLTLKLETGDASIPLLPERGERETGFTWAFSGESAIFEGKSDALFSRVAAAVSAGDTGELRLIELTAGRELSGEVALEFAPSLARHSDYVNHPAFWRLGLTAEERDGALLIRRLPRGDAPGAWLCLACDRPAVFSANAYGQPLGALSYPLVRARSAVSLASGENLSLRFALSFGAEAEAALAAAKKLLRLAPAEFADIARARAESWRMSAHDAAQAMAMTSALVFPHPRGSVTEGRDALWRCGVSGDAPIICAALGDDDIPAARELIRRHALLSLVGVSSDLVFITREGGDYRRVVHRSVSDALERLSLGGTLGARGGVHLCEETVSGEAVRRCAALDISLGGAETRPKSIRHEAPMPPRQHRRVGGRVEYEYGSNGAFKFYVNQNLPVRVWTNVLAGDSFGFLAADCGCGSMWYKNARECRITPWENDPLAASGPETLEALDGGERVSLFAAEDGRSCAVSFGFGWAAWEKELRGGRTRVTAFVPPRSAARVLIIEGAPGDIFWRAELSLSGEARDAQYAVTEMSGGALTARNSRSPFPEAPFTAVFSRPVEGFTCDLGAWLRGEEDGRTGAGLIPCLGVRLGAGDAVIVCGCADEAELRALCSADAARAALGETKAYWSDLTGRVRVSTPSAALNRYMNGWAVYQTVACRMLGRASIYQSGGAYGFRDQLQDAVNMLLIDPSLARGRILDCCAHQYSEGDVMHWWHPVGAGHGVRTRCSDDLIWLPWAVCEYLDATGDSALLGEETPFLISPPLRQDEKSRYETPETSSGTADVLTHAARAIERFLARGEGDHGLPLMGDGDWNDGMDAVGAKGRGESVWLGWFFAHTARRFAAVLESTGHGHDAAALLSAAKRIGRASDKAWDGSWYLRGFFDSGAPLGSRESDGCRIDSIAQSWAAMCAEADAQRVDEGLSSALRALYDRDRDIVRLFAPPFGCRGEDPGYIRGCGEGFRENGGQYTHGAIWLAQALLLTGRAEEGAAILISLLRRRGGEPFVLCADVYAAPERCGEDGWSWYTGSAGWFFRVCASELLGLRLRRGKIDFAPRLPPGWEDSSAAWRSPDGAEQVFGAGGEGA